VFSPIDFHSTRRVPQYVVPFVRAGRQADAGLKRAHKRNHIPRMALRAHGMLIAEEEYLVSDLTQA